MLSTTRTISIVAVRAIFMFTFHNILLDTVLTINFFIVSPKLDVASSDLCLLVLRSILSSKYAKEN